MNASHALTCLCCENSALIRLENTFLARTNTLLQTLGHNPSSGASPHPGPAESPGLLAWLLLVTVILLLVAALPNWPHSRHWGYLPSSSIGLVFLFLIGPLAIGGI